MKHIILIFITALCCTCCSAQKDKEKTTMKTTEKIDLEYYKQKIEEHNTYAGATQAQYIQQNGTQTYVSFNKEGYVLQEIKPYTYEMEIKNYHKNGILKSEGKLLCHSSVKIGLWREYDEKGYLVKETDEDKKFEKLRLKPKDILRWLGREGYIDRRVGKGQEKFVKESNEPDIDINFWVSEDKGLLSKHVPAGWSISITEHSMRTTHGFNAETGEYLGKTTQVLYE